MARNGTNKSVSVVTLTTTATLIDAGRPEGGVLVIQNTSASDVFIGPAGVTTSTGIKLLAATATTIQVWTDTISEDGWYGIVASGTADVRTLKTY